MAETPFSLRKLHTPSRRSVITALVLDLIIDLT